MNFYHLLGLLAAPELSAEQHPLLFCPARSRGQISRLALCEKQGCNETQGRAEFWADADTDWCDSGGISL